MRFSPSDFPQSKTDRGFTLIEVVVGITLMATVLATSLLAFSAHEKQIRQARVKLTALQVADEMLNRMSSSREGIPVSGAGPIPEHPNWSWQTSVVGPNDVFGNCSKRGRCGMCELARATIFQGMQLRNLFAKIW